jgi:hypothetical protein
MWFRHETEVSRGSPKVQISGMPVAATQNAFGGVLYDGIKEEEIFMKTKRLLFINWLAAGAFDYFALIWEAGKEIHRRLSV